MDDTNQTTSSTEPITDEKIDTMLKEMQAMRYQNDVELQADVDELQGDFASERHYLHVTDEAISEELARGLTGINDAADDIALPDDDEDSY